MSADDATYEEGIYSVGKYPAAGMASLFEHDDSTSVNAGARSDDGSARRGGGTSSACSPCSSPSSRCGSSSSPPSPRAPR